MALRVPALTLALMPWFANCAPDAPLQAAVMVPISSWATPLSKNASVALIDGHTACVIVSYEFQVQCLDRAGEFVGVFGGEGDGPGEFRFAYAVVRGDERTVAVIDPLASRLSVFKPTGELVTEVAVPRVFEPLSPIGETTVGTYMPDFLSDKKVLAEVDLSGGAVLWQRELRMPSDIGLPPECGLSWGALSQEEVLAFGACQSQLLFYTVRGEGEVIAIEAPTYTGELPNQRDIDEYREGTRFLYRDGVVPDAAVREFAKNRRVVDRIPGRAMTYDASQRLWVGAGRNRDRSSSLDLYLDKAFLGTVQVQDRMLGFDVLDGTLVVLVERGVDEDADRDGIPDRGVDWYDVRDIELSRE